MTESHLVAISTQLVLGDLHHGKRNIASRDFQSGFQEALWVCVALLVAGGIVSWLLIRNPLPSTGLVDREKALG